ncbi:MAG: hypothetical protein FH756_16630 [Firmicutes bacterium]|nr:hypothetical protein [Bacillota bacterium]
MQLTTSFRRLGQNDFRLIWRDIFLIWILIYYIVIAMVLRFTLPYLNTHFAVSGAVPFTLSDWYPMLVAYFLIFLGAAMSGMVYGFVLLEEKDNNTIKALLVTPLPVNHYIVYRVGVPLLIAFILIMAAVLITGIAVPPLRQLALLAAGASLVAPITALYFAGFAENKVQGLALSKFVGTAGFLIPLAWFTPEPLQFLFGLFPPYWVSKAYWLVLAGNPLWLGALALGIILQVVMIAALANRFNKVIYRDS